MMPQYNPCQIPELKLSCYGCCGREFKSRFEVERDIKLNTLDFKSIKIPSTLKLLQFRDRISQNPDDLMPSGVCACVVDFKDGVIACPLHKNINKLVSKKKFLRLNALDLRNNHCDVNYECETIILWKILSQSQKEDYIIWLGKQNYDNYKYSTGNLFAQILRKYLDKRNKIEF